MDKRNYSNGSDLPLGLTMAMAQYPLALSYFTSLSGEQKEQLIGDVHHIRSQGEMREFVQNMANNAVEPHIAVYPEDFSQRHNI